MKTLSDIRSEYPQYEDLSDKELADKLHARFYSDMDRAEFDSKVGLSAKETPSDLSAIPRGFMSSGAGLLNLAGPGVKALYSGLVGDEEAKKEALGRFAARQQEIEAKYPQTPLSAVLEDPLGKLPSYLGEAVGGTISTAPALLGGGVGGLLGGAIAKRVAADQAKKIALRSALAGSAATALPLETAESYTETKGEALGPSVLAGGFKTGLELLGAKGVLKNAFKDLPEEIIESFLKRAGKEGGKGVVAEGLTEGAQTAVDQVLTSYVGQNPDLFSRDNLLKVADAALRGGIAGGIVRGGSTALQRGQPTEPPPPPEPRGEFLTLSEADSLLAQRLLDSGVQNVPDVAAFGTPEQRIAAAERISKGTAREVEAGEDINRVGLTRGITDVDPILYNLPDGTIGQRADLEAALERRRQQLSLGTLPEAETIEQEGRGKVPRLPDNSGYAEYGYDPYEPRRQQQEQLMAQRLRSDEQVYEEPIYEPLLPNLPLLESPDAADQRRGRLVDIAALPPRQRQEPIAPPRMEEQLPPVREEPLRMPRAETQVGEAFGPRLDSLMSEMKPGQTVYIPAVQEAIGAATMPAVRDALKPYVDIGHLKLNKSGSYTRTKKVPRLDTEPRPYMPTMVPKTREEAWVAHRKKIRDVVQQESERIYGKAWGSKIAKTGTAQKLADIVREKLPWIEVPEGGRLGGLAYPTGNKIAPYGAVVDEALPEKVVKYVVQHELFHVAQLSNHIPLSDRNVLKSHPKILQSYVNKAHKMKAPFFEGLNKKTVEGLYKAHARELQAYALESYSWLKDQGAVMPYAPLDLSRVMSRIYEFARGISRAFLGRRPSDIFEEFLRGDFADRIGLTKPEKDTFLAAIRGGDPLQDTSWRKLVPRLNAFTYIFNTFGRAADKIPALAPTYNTLGDIRRQASTIVHEQLEKLQPLLGLTKGGRREITRFLDDDANNERLTPARVGARNKGGTLKTAADVEAVEAVRSALKGMWQERIKAYKMRFGDKADPKILAELEAAERTAYLPSVRWGQWGVSAHDKDGKLLYLHTFSTPDAYLATRGKGLRPAKVAANYGNQLRRELAKQYPGAKIDDVYAMTYDSMRQFLEARDVAAIEKIAMGLGQLETMGLSQQQVDAYWSEIHDQVAKGTWKRHQQRRKNIPGYLTESNVDRYLTSSLAAYIANGARFIARESNVPAMREAEEALAKAAGQAGGDRIQSYARGMVEYVNTPNFAVDFLKAVGYYNYLGANFSSAVMNLTQFMVATLPYAGMTGGMQGQRIALKAYGDAWQLLFKHPSLIFRGFNLKEKLPGLSDMEWQGLVSRFKDGSIRNATLEDITGSSPQLLGAVSSNASVWAQRTLDALTFFFSAAEGINRASAYLTGHRLYTNEKTRQGVIDALKGTRYEGQEMTADLAGFAFMERTQANMSKENRPLFTRFTPAAEIATQFMSYPVQMAELWAEMAFGRGKAGKMAAAGMMLALLSMAGLVGAVPGGEPAKELAEWGLKKATGKRWDLEEEIRQVATGVLGLEGTEALLHGATRLVGIDTKQRASLGIIPIAPMEEVMRGPVGKMAFDQAAEAYNWYKEGRGDLAAAAFLPLALKNVYKAVSGRMEPLGPVTGSGDTLLRRPLSMPEYFTQGLGFTPKNVAREREYRREEAELVDTAKDTRERFKERATMALANSISYRQKGNEGAALKSLQEFQSILQEAAEHDRSLPPEERARLNVKAVRKEAIQRVFGGQGKGEGRKIPKALRPSLDEKLKFMPRGT